MVTLRQHYESSPYVREGLGEGWSVEDFQGWVDGQLGAHGIDPGSVLKDGADLGGYWYVHPEWLVGGGDFRREWREWPAGMGAEAVKRLLVYVSYIDVASIGGV